jgi:hypothetical protein
MPARATLNGEISDTGGQNCTERGFDWGTDPNNLDQHPTTEQGTFGLCTFYLTITGLDTDEDYYFRAKAKNSVGWGYGSVMSFHTSSITHGGWQTTTSSVALVPLHILRRKMIWRP